MRSVAWWWKPRQPRPSKCPSPTCMGLILSSEESRHHTTSFFLMKVCRHALDHEKSARIEIPNRISHASIPRGARWWRMITLAYLYAVGRQDPNHDAIMRIESEAPRWRLHSSQRRKVHVGLRTPPPRIGIGPGRCRFEPQEMCRCLPSSYAAGRNITPSGISPVVAMRQSAMSSLRASATIIVLRVPLRPSAARVRNH